MVTFVRQMIGDFWREAILPIQTSEVVQEISRRVTSSAPFKTLEGYMTAKTVQDNLPIDVAVSPSQSPAEGSREQKVKDWLQNANNLATVYFCNSSLTSLAMGFIANRITNLGIKRLFDPEPQTMRVNPGDQGFNQAKLALQRVFKKEKCEHVSNVGMGALAILMNQVGLWNQSLHLAFGGPLVCAAINKVIHLAIDRHVMKG